MQPAKAVKRGVVGASLTTASRGLGLAAGLLLGACGAGTFGIVAAGSSGSGGGSAPALNAFQVESAKRAPSVLHLDAPRAVRVSLFYDLGPGEQALHIDDPRVVGNEIDLPPGETTLEWDFAAEFGAGYRHDVHLLARHPGGAVVVGGELVLDLGNDAPTVLNAEPMPSDPLNPDESAGNVEIQLRIQDSSSDPVDIGVRWRRVGDPPEAWTPATPAGVFPDGIATNPDEGAEFSFFWNTNVDLRDEEAAVLFRVTADDRTDESEPFETQVPFFIDNNAAPVAILQDGVLATSPDDTGAVAVPFRLLDEESDPARVLLQWRRVRGEFPDLSSLSRDDLLALLDDPERVDERAELQICSERPLLFEGRALPPPAGFDPATHVMLPELAKSGASQLLISQARNEPLLAGRTLEILRPPANPQPVAAGWAANPLQRPVAALPVGNGPTVLVLDAPAQDSWRLREIDLGNGTVVGVGAGTQRVAFSDGTPNALAYEGERRSVLVASNLADDWRIDRVDLATWTVTRLVSQADGTTEGGSIRAIASLGLGASLITVGDSLVRLDYTTGAPQSQHPAQAVTLLDGFATPWGIALDPLHANRLYLAERDYPRRDGGTGRVTTLELDTYIQSSVFVRDDTAPGAGFERPTSIALERHGARLLAVTDAGHATHELRGIDIGGREPGVVFESSAELGIEVSALATGADGVRLLALPGANELAVAGGVLERRSVSSFDPSSLTVCVSEPFDPKPGPYARWRMARELGTALSSPQGAQNLFVWDSRDVPEGEVLLRLVPMDTDIGVGSSAELPKRVRSFRAPKILGGFGTLGAARGLEAVDVDHDGRLDLVASSHGIVGDAPGLAVFLQRMNGSFGGPVEIPPPDLTLGSPGHAIGMWNLAAGDLNADGRTDLVGLRSTFAQSIGTGLEDSLVLLDQPEGAFVPDQVETCELGLPPADDLGGQFLRIADFDRDRRPDLVVANDFFGVLPPDPRPGTLTLFYQRPSAGNCAFPDLPDRVLTGGKPIEVTVADLNADGLLDLISTPDRNLAIYLQDPAKGFLDDPDLLLPTSDLDVAANEVAAADLNGDGRIDLVSNFIGRAPPFPPPEGISLHFQPDAGFSGGALPDVCLQDPQDLDAGNAILVADVDGDDRQDVIEVSDANNTLSVFLQGASGRFTPSADIVVGHGEVFKAYSGLAADLDGDGRLDLGMTGAESFNLALYPQISPGAFSGTPDQELGVAPLTGMEGVETADLDGDGRQDLIVTNTGSYSLALFLQKSSGGFFSLPDTQIGTPSSTPAPRSVVAVDLDGDSRNDLVCACADPSGSGTLAVFLQDSGGAGAFETEPSQVLVGSTRQPGSLLAADIDADGELDLVCANPGSDLLTVFRQDVAGRFSVEPVRLGGTGLLGEPVAVVAADLNADGRVDLASANAASHDLALFFQPSGGFVPSGLPAAPDARLGGATSTSSPSTIAAEDLDGDGWLDLVVGTSSSVAGAALFRQPRTGFVSESVPDSVFLLPEPCHALALADLNLDGLLDLTAATGSASNGPGGAVRVFFQRSSGFAEEADLILGASAGLSSYAALVASDLNNDGELDLATTSWRIVGPTGLRDDRITLFFGGK